MGGHHTESGSCACYLAPFASLVRERDLGMDEHFAAISLWRCVECGRRWLHYLYEVEAFSQSGRWYLGAVGNEEAAQAAAENAQATLEALPWYFCGGSYFGGKPGKSAGRISVP